MSSNRYFYFSGMLYDLQVSMREVDVKGNPQKVLLPAYFQKTGMLGNSYLDKNSSIAYTIPSSAPLSFIPKTTKLIRFMCLIAVLDFS